MQKSSALKSQLNFFDGADGPGDLYIPLLESNAAPSSKVEFPNFATYGGTSAYAVTARLAGRVNAANVSSAELKELLHEREQLIFKQINNQITRKETHRLEYIRWSLDRVEDARYGHSLDALESLVEYYEKFEADLQGLKSQLEGIRKRK
jgi:hypothetical protein